MIATGYHRNPRWGVLHRAELVYRHRHEGRSEAWQLILLSLAMFWALVGFGISALG